MDKNLEITQNKLLKNPEIDKKKNKPKTKSTYLKKFKSKHGYLTYIYFSFITIKT